MIRGKVEAKFSILRKMNNNHAAKKYKFTAKSDNSHRFGVFTTIIQGIKSLLAAASNIDLTLME